MVGLISFTFCAGISAFEEMLSRREEAPKMPDKRGRSTYDSRLKGELVSFS